MVVGLNFPSGTDIGDPPLGGGVFSLTTAPQGGWSSQQHPRSAYYNGKTYFGWVNGVTDGIYVASYDHATQTVSTPFLIDTPGGGPDDHNNPAVLVRDSDKRIIVAFCAHGGPNMYTRISTNPEDVTAFAAAVNMTTGASNHTYPQLVQLTGVTNDPIYCFFRDVTGSTGRISFCKSTNSGTSYASRVIVMTSASTNRPNWTLGGTTTRIDLLSGDRDPYGSEGAVDVGHMYLDGSTDKWYTSAGVEITATKPFAHSELTQLETNLGGALMGDGVAGTNPVFVYLVDNGDSTITARYARWDGASWDKADIYTATYHPVDRYYGGLAINQADPEEVFSGKYASASVSELYTYTSGDLGLTWDAGAAITSGSGDLNASVISVKDGDATLPALWLRGTLGASFNFGIQGLSR